MENSTKKNEMRRLICIIGLACAISGIFVVSVGDDRYISPALLRVSTEAEAAHDDDCQAGEHCIAFGSGSMQTSKNTWACTEPIAFAEWMLQYLPTTPWMVGSYEDILYGDDGKFVGDMCFVTGKVFLGESGAFQLHAVDTAAESSLGVRPMGNKTLAEMEAGINEAIQKGLSGAVSVMVPFMEWNVGLWTADLDYYADLFAEADIATHVLRWPSAESYRRNSGDPDLYYSLLVNVPNTTIVLELISAEPKSPTLIARAKAGSRSGELPRFSGSLPPTSFNASARIEGKPAMQAVKVSYATTDADRDEDFYTNQMNASLVLSVTRTGKVTKGEKTDKTKRKEEEEVAVVLVDGGDEGGDEGGAEGGAGDAVAVMEETELRRAFWFEGDNSKSVEIHVVQLDQRSSRRLSSSAGHSSSAEQVVLVQGGDAEKEEDDDNGSCWSVLRYEEYATALHFETMSSSHVNGSDALLDNHFGRRLGNSGQVLDGLTGALDDVGGLYRLWQQTNNNTSPPSVGYFTYVVAPGGNAIQVVGDFDALPSGIEEWSSCLV